MEELFPPAVWIGVGSFLLASEHLVNEGSMQGRRLDMLINGWVPGTPLAGGVPFDRGMLNSFRLVAYLCQKLEPVTVPVPLL